MPTNDTSLQERVLLADCTIRVKGNAWFIPAHYRPGDRVTCLPSPSGADLLIQDPRRALPDIWAEPVAHPHNHLRTAHTPHSDVHWGIPTTSALAAAGRVAHRHGTPSRQPLPTAPENMRHHKTDSEPSAHLAPASSISEAHPMSPCCCCHRKCIHRPRCS